MTLWGGRAGGTAQKKTGLAARFPVSMLRLLGVLAQGETAEAADLDVFAQNAHQLV